MRSPSIFNSNFQTISWVFEIQLKVLFTSIDNDTISFFLDHLCYTLYTYNITASIIHLFFQVFI